MGNKIKDFEKLKKDNKELFIHNQNLIKQNGKIVRKFTDYKKQVLKIIDKEDNKLKTGKFKGNLTIEDRATGRVILANLKEKLKEKK